MTANEEVMQELYYSSHFLKHKAAQIAFLVFQLHDWQRLLPSSNSASKNGETLTFDVLLLLFFLLTSGCTGVFHPVVCGLSTCVLRDPTQVWSVDQQTHSRAGVGGRTEIYEAPSTARRLTWLTGGGGDGAVSVAPGADKVNAFVSGR